MRMTFQDGPLKENNLATSQLAVMNCTARRSPEDRLIISSVFVQNTRDERALVSTGNFNWSYLLDASIYHRIVPIVYANLQRSGCLDAVPAPVLEAFRKNYIQNNIRNQHLYDEIEKAGVYLSNRGIPFMLIKGAALATLVYEDIGQRPMSDIDIMILERDRGWYEVICEDLEREGVRFNLLFELDINHHDLTMNRMIPVNIERVWDRAMTTTIRGVKVLVMSPEDQILTLVVACCRKGFNNLRFYCDFSRICDRFGEKIDWNDVTANARMCSLETALDAFLKIARVFSPDIVPEKVVSHLAQSEIRRKALDFLINRQFREGKTIGCPGPVYRHLLKFAVGNPTIISRRLIRLLRSALFIGSGAYPRL